MEECQFVDQFIGDTFLHIPTNRKITIDGFDMNLRPSQAFPHAQFKTYAEFYTKCLGQKNISKDQFLVYTSKRFTTFNKEGKKVSEDRKTYYLPQFLKRTGMTEDQKNDRFMMKDTAQYTKIEPAVRERMQADFLVNHLIKNINSNSSFKNCASISTSSTLSALKLPKPQINFGCNQHTFPEKGNFFIKGKIFDHEKAVIENWVIIWENDFDYCRDFEASIIKAAQTIGVNLGRPKCLQLKHNKSAPLEKSISDLLKSISTSKPKIVINLAEKGMQKHGYKPFKKLCRENGLQSQQAVVDHKNLEKKGYFDSLIR